MNFSNLRTWDDPMPEIRVAQHDSLPHRALRAATALAAAALIAASALFAASPAYAAGFTAGDYEYDTTGATTATVTGYTGDPTAEIPSTASDGTTSYTVTAIDSGAFSGKGLTSVTIPGTVVSIGSNAFGSNSLTNVAIPDSVTAMGSYSFQWNSLTSVTLGSGLTSIPDGTFFGNQLGSIDIPDTITSIGNEAFVNNAFTTVTIPDSVTSIGASAFSVSSLLTSVSFGKSLTSIGDYAFAGTNLTSVTIPASVTEIGDRAFDSASLTSAVFQGGAPSTFTARSTGHGSFGDQDVTVYYSSAHGADFTPSPWQGYVTAQGAILTFDLGGHGPTITPAVVIPGGVVPAPTDPVASGYTFLGWFTTTTGDVPYDFAAPLNGDATAYAHWAASGLAETGSDPLPLIIAGGLLSLIGALVLMVGVRTRRSSMVASRVP